MTRYRWTAAAVGAVLLGVGVPTAAAVTPAQAPTDPCPSSSETSDGVVTTDEVVDGVDAVACDLIGLELRPPAPQDANGELPTIEIPPPGEGVEMSLFALEAEDDVSYYVGVNLDGELELGAPEKEVAVGSGACEDGAYNLLTYPMNLNETFNIKVATFPNYVNEADTRASIVDGLRAWPRVHNDCDMTDNVNATAEDGGGSDAVSSVGPGGCNQVGNDQLSLITFGGLPNNLLGGTCRHIVYSHIGNYSDGGDLRLNSVDWEWTNRPNRENCVELDIQSVVAHEAGHWWGIGHVGASAHPNLTMRDSAGTNGGPFRCNDKMRTLGKGDVLGMRDYYRQ